MKQVDDADCGTYTLKLGNEVGDIFMNISLKIMGKLPLTKFIILITFLAFFYRASLLRVYTKQVASSLPDAFKQNDDDLNDDVRTHYFPAKVPRRSHVTNP